MKKNELIARLVNRNLTSGAPRNFFCYGATAPRNDCYAAVDQRPAQAAPAK
jgi:hypothetical protein